MRCSTYRFALDLQKHQSQMSIAVYANDSAVRLYITLTDGGLPYYIENGCRAVFYGMRPDEKPLIHNCMIEGNCRIIYDFNESTAKEGGITECQIRLYGKDGELISAPRFIIVVDERVVTEMDLDEEDENKCLSALDELFASEVKRDIAENGLFDEEGNLVEGGRTQAEEARASAEEKRDDAEKARAVAETARAEAENARAEAENARVDAEEFRNGKEKIRSDAENARVNAEKARVEEFNERNIAYGVIINMTTAAEEKRVEAENARVEAERARAEAASQIISELQQFKEDIMGDLASVVEGGAF